MKNLLLVVCILGAIQMSGQRIAPGYYHSLTTCYDGTTMAWGGNSWGSLGDGTNVYSTIPVASVNVSNIIKIASGAYHSLALKDDGTVMSWGRNEYGALGDGTNAQNYFPTLIPNLTGVIDIACGGYHSIVLKEDGTVWTFGHNNYGQLMDETTTNSNIPVQALGLPTIIAIAAGDDHSLLLASDHTMWAGGINDQGQLGNGTTLTTFTGIPTQVIDLTDVITIAGNGYKSSYAVKADGTVWSWGYNQQGALGNGTLDASSVPVQVTDLTDVIALAAHGGYGHQLALKQDGTVWAWGYNLRGQLGNNTIEDSTVPVQVLGMSNVVEIGAGHHFSMALTNDGSIYMWGSNDTGQLGNGDLLDRLLPEQVIDICSMVSSVSELEESSLFILYPNPSNTFIHLSLTDPGQWKNALIEVYDVQGKLVLQEPSLSLFQTIDLSSVAKGIFEFRISDTNKSRSQKILLE
jgi:alpha-tubulin suppressor-like RCC1 family protein